MAKQISSKNTWEPSIFKRYVFFESLDKDNPQLAENVRAHFNSYIYPDEEKDKDRYDEYINYMQAYIQNLEALATAERAKELQYVQSLRYAGISTDIYYTENRFDYIKFIADLNLVHTNVKKLKSVVKTNKLNMEKVQKTLDEAREKSASEQLQQSEREIYQQLTQDYIFAYGNYTTAMNDQIGSQLQATFSDEVNSKLQQILSTLSKNPNLIQALIDNLQKKDQQLNITEAIQNWCVEYLRQELISNKQDIKKVLFNPENIDETKINKIFDDSLSANYHSTMTTVKSTVEKIIDSALNRGENIANMLRDSKDNSLDELLNMINADQKTRDMITNAFKQMQESITEKQDQNGISLDKIKQSVASIKGNFTRKLNAIILEHLNQQKRGLKKEERDKIINPLVRNYERQLDSNINTAAQSVGRKLSITSTSSNSVAEILASPDFEGWLKDNVQNLFIPGKELQYKTDLTFNFNTDSLLSNIKSVWEEGDPSASLAVTKEMAENKGKMFLQRYQELSKGATSVEKAEQAYRETLQKALQAKRDLLSQVDENSQKMIDTYFNNGLEGSISVKDYHFYNNEYGYHMGSMGGGGRVIDAVPNIIKMLELGGISGLDVEVIIQALLNSFNGSVIGTKLLDDIKTLLIGGAAMMLFDDGFANAQAYLQRMQEELHVNSIRELPTGGSLHLLYLNNIYIPQSYILFSIIPSLKKLYSEIISKTRNSNSIKQKNSLELENPLSNATLQHFQNDSNYPTKPLRWNAVSDYAQQNVKLHFLFMAGMLDIMQELEKAFQNY